MRNTMIPSDEEIQVLLDKEQQARERRNREMLGNPSESLDDYRLRKAAMIAAGEIAILESEEIREAEIAKQREEHPEGANESSIEQMNPKDWEKHKKVRAEVHAAGAIIAVGLCVTAASYEMWVAATAALALAWGQYFFWDYWRGAPKENSEYSKYAAMASGNRRLGWYLSVLGVFAEVTGVFWNFVSSIQIP